MIANDCSLSTWEAKAEGSWVQGQPGLDNRTYLKTDKKNSVKMVKEVGMKGRLEDAFRDSGIH